jgi:hypothetical protein
VVPPPPSQRYSSSGSYEQVVDGAQCAGTDKPLWGALGWTASIPNGTTLQWAICAGDTDAAVAACAPQTVATVTTGAACTTNSTCPNGYCNTAGLCEYVTGPACSASTDCGTNGVCVSSVCRWTSNPIDVKPTAAHNMQGLQKMRVRATLLPDSTQTKAPSVFDWSLNYTCSPQL